MKCHESLSSLYISIHVKLIMYHHNPNKSLKLERTENSWIHIHFINKDEGEIRKEIQRETNYIE